MLKNLKKLKSLIPKITILFLFSFFLILTPLNSSKATPTPNTIYFTPQIEIPNSSIKGTDIKVTGDLLGKYIEAIYNYGLAIGAILAAIVIMFAGIIWLTSAGSQEKVGQAKKMFGGSIVGLFILFGSYLILNTISPNLVETKTINLSGIDNIQLSDILCCEMNNKAVMTTQELCKKYGGTQFINTGNYVYIAGAIRCEKYELSCVIQKECDKVEWCYESFSKTKPVGQYNCGSFIKPNYKDIFEVKTGACATIPECSNINIDCRGITNGEKCPKTATGIELNCYCYNNAAYTKNSGTAGDPCGKKDEAFCSDIKCNKLDGGTKYEREGQAGTINNGRGCEYPLQCCYPKK